MTFFINNAVANVVNATGQECQLVFHTENISFTTYCRKLQRLVNLLRIICLCGIAPVWMHQTINAEISVVGIIAKVTTICPVFLTTTALGEQSLVLEVPDEFTRQTRIVLVEVEHITNITH